MCKLPCLSLRSLRLCARFNRAPSRQGRKEIVVRLVLAVLLIGFGAEVPRSAGQETKARRSDAVVKVSAKADKPDADGKQMVTVTLKIDDNWHTYANTLPKDFPGVPTSVKVNAKTKLEDVKVDYPEGKLIREGDYKGYEGTVPIKVTVRRPKNDTSPLEVNVTFQSCTKTSCLFPATVKLSVP
jgi:DsbC/DsbD-like thiol-disulfide interchange protein